MTVTMKASYEEILDRLNGQLASIAPEGAEFDESTDLVEGLGLDSDRPHPPVAGRVRGLGVRRRRLSF